MGIANRLHILNWVINKIITKVSFHWEIKNKRGYNMIADSVIEKLIFEDLTNNTPQKILSLYTNVEISSIDEVKVNSQVELDNQINIEGTASINLVLSADSRDSNPTESSFAFTFNICLNGSTMNIVNKNYQFDLHEYYE